MRKFTFLFIAIYFFNTSSAIDALKFPNLVLYKEIHDKGYFEIAYDGELSKLKLEISSSFQNKYEEAIKPSDKGAEIVWSQIKYPIMSPEEYSLSLENVKGSKIIRISFKSDSMGIDILHSYSQIRRKLADKVQALIDKSLGTEYEELSEKFNVPYLNGGMPKQEALTAHLYLYTTQNTDSIITKMVDAFQAIASPGSGLTRSSASVWQLDSLVMPELAMDKVFSIVFRVRDLSQGSYKIEMFAAYYDPKDWMRDKEDQSNYAVRYYDLHYRLRWYLSPLLF